MKELTIRVWRHFRAMPSTLRGLVIFLWVIGALMTLLATVQFIAPAELAASEADQLQLSAGEQVVLSCSGPAMFLTAILFWHGRPWVRHAIMLGIAGIGLSVFVYPESREVPAGMLLFCAGLIVSLGAWYFYFDRGVRGYFTENTK
jgi:hypothetical protein